MDSTVLKMDTLARQLILLRIVYLVFSILPLGVTAAQSTHERIHNALSPSASLDQPGFILTVVDGSKVKYQFQSGAAAIEYAQAITDESVFHIASLSKQITAAALAIAIQKGKLAITDPVGKWLPAARKYGTALRIDHLVYMTSGIREYYDQLRNNGSPWSTFHDFDINDAIEASLSADRLDFTPGTKWRYSNINYMLLTQIVSKAFNMEFDAIVDRYIFKPLAMDSAMVHTGTTRVIRHRAYAYRRRTNKTVREIQREHDIDVGGADKWMLIHRNSPHKAATIYGMQALM